MDDALFADRDFDSDTLDALKTAFEKARDSLHDTGQPQLVKDIIAGRIMDAARAGERDADALAEHALSALGLKAGQ